MVASIAAVVGKAVDFCANKHPTYEHRVNDPGTHKQEFTQRDVETACMCACTSLRMRPACSSMN